MIGSSVMYQWNDRRRRKFRDRSIVRMIASRLPLKPLKRAYFEVDDVLLLYLLSCLSYDLIVIFSNIVETETTFRTALSYIVEVKHLIFIYCDLS